MSKIKPRLRVTKESPTGMNLKFHDNKTGETIGRMEAARLVNQCKLPGYHHYRDEKGQLIIRSNANHSTGDNLG